MLPGIVACGGQTPAQNAEVSPSTGGEEVVTPETIATATTMISQ